MAFFEAEGGGDASRVQGVAEGPAAVFAGALPGEALDGVVRDEVDLGVEALGVAGEQAGLFGGVVEGCLLYTSPSPRD